MTRIDIHPPKLLCDQHLISNHREIKRICNRLVQRLEKNKFDDLPAAFYVPAQDKFRELFWVDKGLWTFNRYKELRAECLRRGFKVSDFSENWKVYEQKPEYYQDFTPTTYHYDLLEKRIMTRTKEMKIRYYGKELSWEEYCSKIWKNS